MGKVRLKLVGDGQRPLSLEGAGTPIPLSPLNISGLVIQRAELVEALRPFVPLPSDVVSFEDGERFLLVLKQP
ncbi:MAG: hypothetical protein M1136_04585, partial [Chloroflexi bacterium]|nr:hypothetical protein [Chloroflexota bacterium]